MQRITISSLPGFLLPLLPGLFLVTSVFAGPLAVPDEADRAKSDADSYIYLWLEPREGDGERISIFEVRVEESGFERVSFRGEALESLVDPATIIANKGAIYTFSNKPGLRVEAIGVGRGSLLAMRVPLQTPLERLGSTRVAVQFWHGNAMTPSLRASLEPDPDKSFPVATGLAETAPSGRMAWAAFFIDSTNVKAIQSGTRDPIEGDVSR